MPSPSSLGVSSLLSHLTMSSPLLALTPSCIPPWVETFWSHVGLPSTSRSLEPDITLQSSISSANPFLKLNTIRHDLSATSLHSRDLLRQLSKERLIVRCSPISARQSLKRRKQLRLTLSSAPSTTLRRALRLLHLIGRVSSVRIPSQESSHFGGIESRDCGRWRSAVCCCSAIA